VRSFRNHPGQRENPTSRFARQPRLLASNSRLRRFALQRPALKRTAAMAGGILLAVLLTTAGSGRSRKQASAGRSDPGYVTALATANHFLHDWQTGSLADGMVLLSDGIRHSRSADELEQFFAAATERGFEIRSGHGNHGRYSFPVVLITLAETPVSGGSGAHASCSRKSSEIVLVDAGKNDWVVDKLP